MNYINTDLLSVISELGSTFSLKFDINREAYKLTGVQSGRFRKVSMPM